MRLMRNFGFRGNDNVIYIGTNGKMTEVCAAMGLTSLESVNDFIRKNRSNYETYSTELAGIPGLSLMPYDRTQPTNYQYLVVEVDEANSGLTRDELVAVLVSENVLARRYFFPGCHRMEPYRSFFPNAGVLLPETEKLCNRIMVLPTGTAVNDESILTICRILRIAIQNSSAVGQRLARSARFRSDVAVEAAMPATGNI
jgi:dTDP-4-amino-4,6-dideoxygalactose transaminase